MEGRRPRGGPAAQPAAAAGRGDRSGKTPGAVRGPRVGGRDTPPSARAAVGRAARGREGRGGGARGAARSPEESGARAARGSIAPPWPCAGPSAACSAHSPTPRSSRAAGRTPWRSWEPRSPRDRWASRGAPAAAAARLPLPGGACAPGCGQRFLTRSPLFVSQKRRGVDHGPATLRAAGLVERLAGLGEHSTAGRGWRRGLRGCRHRPPPLWGSVTQPLAAGGGTALPR